MKNPSTTFRLRSMTTALAVFAIGGLMTSPAHAAPLPVPVATDTVTIVDPSASDATRSLFSYLRDVRGNGILFGQQHATDYGVTIGTPDGIKSDLFNAVADNPGVFGWDTLIIDGYEKPGTRTNTAAANIALLAENIKKADAMGGVNTLSGHVYNFLTGNDFYDTTGRVVASILPGGAKNAELNAYLDNVAALAQASVDADGKLIPIIYRPWHENAGSWFWWGAANTSPGEYIELFRYTVEYLRDVKGVTNFLYSYSPGSGFGGDPAVYLRTYPGDDYVDILGYDAYGDRSAPDSWRAGVVADLGMLSDLADAKGKVSALTEFGVSGGLKANGANGDLAWFTKLLAAIKGDAKAKNSAYMLTWANFDTSQFFTPYAAATGIDAHEMLPDIQALAADDFSFFASDLSNVTTRPGITTTPHAASMHIVSPAAGSRITASPATVRVRVSNVSPEAVSYTVGSDPTEHTLALDANGYYSGPWVIPTADLNNSTKTVNVSVTVGGAVTLTDSTSVVLGERPVYAAGVLDTFEGYGDNTALAAEYSQVGNNTISLETTSVGEGSKAMRVDYDFALQEYTGVVKPVTGDWSSFEDLTLWVKPDGTNNKIVLQLVADGVSFEVYPDNSGTTAGYQTFPFDTWRAAPWDTAHADARITEDTLTKLSQFNIYVNSDPAATATSGSIVVDDIRATHLRTSGFTDVALGDPFFKEIRWMGTNGISTGLGDGSYAPKQSVTREAVAAFLYRYSGDTYAPVAGQQTFSDVAPGDPFYLEIEWMAATGLANGYADGRFGASDPISREAVAAFLHRMGGTRTPSAPAPFSDVPAGSVFADAIAWLAEVGVINGYSDGRFGPSDPISREAMAAFLYRFDLVPPPPPETIPMFDFESGNQGWTPGTVTDGQLSFTTAAGGSWVGVEPIAFDLTGRTQIRVDLTATTGVDPKMALKLGGSWTWCETSQVGWQNSGTTRVGDNALVFDLTSLSDSCKAMLNDVKSVNIFFNEGSDTIDNVVAR